MTLTLVRPTKIFQFSSKIVVSILVLMIIMILFLPNVLPKSVVKILVIGEIILAVIALVSKKFVDIGTLKCYDDTIEIVYEHGENHRFEIRDISSMKVSVVAYRGGRVGLTVIPHHGCSNTIKFNGNGHNIKHDFRIESRSERERVYNLMKKWTLLNENVSIIKAIV